jgi:hypothetical protein
MSLAALRSSLDDAAWPSSFSEEEPVQCSSPTSSLPYKVRAVLKKNREISGGFTQVLLAKRDKNFSVIKLIYLDNLGVRISQQEPSGKMKLSLAILLLSSTVSADRTDDLVNAMTLEEKIKVSV